MTEQTPVSLEAAGVPQDAMRRLAELQPGKPGAIFTSDLSVNEFLLVREAGFRPLGLVLGSSIYHVGLQIGRWGKNSELDVLSQAMYHARELAMTRMEAEADALAADGIVGVRLDVEMKEFGSDIAEFIAVGTAVKAEEGAGVSLGDLACGECFLHRGGRAEEADAVRDRRAVLADTLRHLLLRHPELGDECAVRDRLFERIEVRPLDVLDERKFEHLMRRRVLDDDGHLPQPGAAGRLPAPLPGDDPVGDAVRRVLAGDEQLVDDAVLRDRGRE